MFPTLLQSFVLLSSVVGSAMSATVYMAGDSTMASGGASGTGNTQGWGVYLGNYLDLAVQDKATAGRSARSYTREGRFAAIANVVQKGDFVIIEMGHNDGGSLKPDNGRSDCPGDGDQTCQTTFGGMKETVYTYSKYIENAAASYKAKGATVIIASQTPNDPYEGGSFSYSPGRFVGYAQTAATTSKVTFIDHGAYVANEFKALGKATVTPYFPNDHTHTSPAGADVVAEAFVRGLLCSSNALKDHVKTPNRIRGNCI